MTNNLGGEVIGELLETGKAVVKQAQQISPGKIVKTAAEQVTKASGGSDVPPGLEDLKGKKVTSTQLQQMKQNDAGKQKQEINSTRIALNRLIMQRYRQMQQDVLKEGKEREQEEMQKKQEEVQELQQKKIEEEQNAGSVALPKGKGGKGIGIFAKQKKGSRETKLGKMG